jgi:formamidopyrimidine-DNA glycosylase
MPELPEVETVRRSLLPRVLGRRIAGLRLSDFPGVLGEADVAELSARLAEREIVGARRRGKYLIFDLDDGTALVVHLRMTGSLVLAPRAAPALRFQRLAIELDDGNDLRFADQRKFGRVLHYRPDDLDRLDARLGPEPLEDAFTAEELTNRLRGRTARIKSLLLDQRIVGGLGNIYADEALFRSGIHPLRAGGSLNVAEAAQLHRAIQEVLQEGIGNRGTSFSSFRDGYGKEGGNQENLRVYGRGRRGEPCPRCGGPLATVTIGGRTSHYCPHCQPAPIAG